MFDQFNRILLTISTVLVVSLFAGCSDDPAGPVTGSVVINPSPDSINAPWTLNGPGNYIKSGNGDQTVSGAVEGAYTVTWGDVAGWIAPSNETRTLTGGATVTLNGVYKEEADPGTVVIDPSPDVINVPWTLDGPDNYAVSNTGDATLNDLVPGDYTVTWGAVTGWITPSGGTKTLASDSTVTFSGVYVEEPGSGTVVIDPSPDAINAPWMLDGPAGYSRSGSGDETLSGLALGDYTVTWGAVTGWITPSGETKTPATGVPVTFSGVYVEDPGSGTIVIDPSPDAINAPWTLDGPAGYSRSGNGDETLSGLALGDYTVTWGAVTGWITPSGETKTPATGVPVTFSGVYVEDPGSGTIVIDPSPDAINAPWTLNGPGGYVVSGSGDQTVSDAVVGDYTVTWGDVAGWIAPSSGAQTLVGDATVTFSGVYVEDPSSGTIVIDPSPDGIHAGWTLNGPGGYAASDTGNATFSNLTPGDYTVTWDDVAGWITPSGETKTLMKGLTVTFRGVYAVETDSGTIVIDPSPDAISAPWYIYGPSWSSRGNGNETLSGMLTGDYTVTWNPVTGWTAPSSQMQTLTADATVTFSGNYVEMETGTIEIDQTPDVLVGAGWVLRGPQNSNGQGDLTITDMPVGSYTVSWRAVTGWTAPSNQTLILTDDATVMFDGTYVEAFVRISAGAFTMGSSPGEYGHESNETEHTVALTTPFDIFDTEVTNRQYADLAQWAYDQGYCMATSSSLRDNFDGSTAELLNLDDADCEISFAGGTFGVDAGREDRPVIIVSWYGAVAYCDWMSLKGGLPRAYEHVTWKCNGHDPYNATGWRLPTEAEWEYACRAESWTAFANGEITDLVCSDPVLNMIGWYCGNANNRTHSVGQLNPNDWGLHDMHGNVFEWCNDWYTTYGGGITDPVGPESGVTRVLRGGGQDRTARDCRSAYRYQREPGYALDNIGFRPVRSAN